MITEIDLTLAQGFEMALYFSTSDLSLGPDITLTVYSADKSSTLFTKTSTTVQNNMLTLTITLADIASIALGDYPYDVSSGGNVLREGTCHAILGVQTRWMPPLPI